MKHFWTLSFIIIIQQFAISAQTTKFAPQDIEEIKVWMLEVSPLPDHLNTPDSVWTQAAIATLQAQAEMPWGDKIPAREFRHFVAPLRINNEPIDGHRPEIYAALKDRVKDLSMAEAILEVNHWCHEYVTYQPSDSRTHSPLQSMSALIGRCGEESTFTVAALRAVGIPSRQVYTPRWAHTDDNHAWVEAWADGQWHFLGACEPEPVLDLGWFNAPAARGMMMHTFVRGDYDGPEEVAYRNADGVNINVTMNYAPVAKTTVKVLDANGQPKANAKVSFRLYNYAEFYPLVNLTTNDLGEVSCTTGLGDMVVWATDGSNFQWQKATAGDSIEITLDGQDTANRDYDLTPPKASKNSVPLLTEEQTRLNACRLAHEDSLRNAKAACTFLATDDEWHTLLKDARGNGPRLKEYLQGLPDSLLQKAKIVLKYLSVKDFSDIDPDVISDQILSPWIAEDEDLVSPRISNEFLQPWRAYLKRELAPQDLKSPIEVAALLDQEIKLVPDWHPARVHISPANAWQAKKANAESRDLLFVAACRALDFPARLNPVNGKPQWREIGTEIWHNTIFKDTPMEKTIQNETLVKLEPDSCNAILNPGYYYNFTISKIVDGEPQLLSYDEDVTLDALNTSGLRLEPGLYMIVTGQRLADGTVLTRTSFHKVNEGDQALTFPLSIRHDESQIEVIGTFNSENRYFDPTTGSDRSILSATGRGYYALILIKPGHEPSNHVVNDLKASAADLAQAGFPIVLLQQGAPTDANPSISIPNLHFGIDSDHSIEQELLSLLPDSPADLPIIIVADTFNRLLFISSGYTIASPLRLLSLFTRLSPD